MEYTSTLREELYRRCSPEGVPIPILVQPEEIKEEPLGGEDIEVEVQGLRTGRAGYPSGMRIEHLQGWLREETQENDPAK